MRCSCNAGGGGGLGQAAGGLKGHQAAQEDKETSQVASDSDWTRGVTRILSDMRKRRTKWRMERGRLVPLCGDHLDLSLRCGLRFRSVDPAREVLGALLGEYAVDPLPIPALAA